MLTVGRGGARRARRDVAVGRQGRERVGDTRLFFKLFFGTKNNNNNNNNKNVHALPSRDSLVGVVIDDGRGIDEKEYVVMHGMMVDILMADQAEPPG
jgi:hypothetical protein